jgi:hypothetical protein
VAVLDVRHRQLSWARDRFPAPWLRRRGRLIQLEGESAGRLERGRTELTDDWLLLVATDGVAHLPTRGEKPFWIGRDLRQLVANSGSPEELVERIGTRIRAHQPPEGADDRLVVAIGAGSEG